MSVEAMALVLHHSRAKGTDKLVLLGIANHLGDGGAFPAVATLAKYANVSERSVQTSIRKLVQLGEVHVWVQGGGFASTPDHERPNRYEVLVSCPPGCDRSANHRVRSLPAAPADLWIDPVKPASPGEAHVTRGVKPTSPGGVKPASPEPSLETTSNSVGREGSPSAHAHVGELPLCSVCLLTYDQCVLRERTSGHTYQPVLHLDEDDQAAAS